MDFKRKTKRLSGLPIAFYVGGFLLVILLFSFNSVYYRMVPQLEPILTNVEESVEDSIPAKPEIYIPDVEVLPLDSNALAQQEVVEEKKEEVKKEEKNTETKEKIEDNKTLAKNTKKEEAPKETKETTAKDKKEKEEKITKIGTDRQLIAFIPGTMGKAGKLPPHNCKTKGELVMFITVDKAGNVTNAGRAKGIKDECNIIAAVIWLKQYVKAKKSQNISQGTYTIVF